jgi:hypothetical protein
MPVFEIELSDGRVFQVESDTPPSEQDVLSALGNQSEPATPAAPEEQGSGGATATLMAGRGVPAAIRSAGRFAANHPAGTQKAIGAGISTVASGIGAGIGGVPGAVVGASIRGVTPAQAVIRETAGRVAGETPAVAKNAGRAVAVANYATEAGLPLKPQQLVSTGTAAEAIDNYAEKMGQRIPRVLDQYGKVVVGPEAPKLSAQAGPVRQAAGRVASGIGRILAPLSAMTGATDFAQTIEPTRRDIGVMGIGASQPDPSGAELDALNQRNIAAMQQRQRQQDEQWSQMRAAILSRLGLR